MNTPTSPVLAAATPAPDNVETRIFGKRFYVEPSGYQAAVVSELLQEGQAKLLAAQPAAKARIESTSDFIELARLADELGEEYLSSRFARRAREAGRLAVIDDVALNHMSGSLTLDWSARGIGFGQLHFYKGADGKLHADTECMDRQFVRSVLLRLADEVVIED